MKKRGEQYKRKVSQPESNEESFRKNSAADWNHCASGGDHRRTPVLDCYPHETDGTDGLAQSKDGTDGTWRIAEDILRVPQQGSEATQIRNLLAGCFHTTPMVGRKISRLA